MKIFIDGKYYDERAAKISVFDHGLLYGDGIFEGFAPIMAACSNSRSTLTGCFIRPGHLLKIPMSPAQIMRATVEACRKNKIRDGYIRLVVTRGMGTLGLNPKSCKKPIGHHHRGQNPALSAGSLPGAVWTSSRCPRRAICTARSIRPSNR